MHIIARFDTGGAEKSMVELCNLLSDQNEVLICAFKSFDNKSHLFQNINKNITTKEFNKSNKLGYFKFVKFLKNENPQIVHGHLSPTIILLLLSKLFVSFPKYYYTVHYNTSEITGHVNKLLHIIAFSILKIKVVSISHITDLHFRNAVRGVHSTVIYNGINPIPLTSKSEATNLSILKLKPTSDTKILITVGRIVPIKNYTLLISAVNILINKGLDIILLIIGKDTSSDDKEINKLKNTAGKNIYFIGEQSNIGDYLATADLFCLSSLEEALPTVLIEACSVGLPMISTDVGGVSEIVQDNYNGFLSPNMEVYNYVSCIEKFLNLNPIQLGTMKINALETYKNKFTVDTMKNEYVKLYNEVL